MMIINKQILLAILILLGFSLSQRIDSIKNINLQENEICKQDLSEFYQGVATNIEWPINLDESQRIYPYIFQQQLENILPFRSLANFEVSQTEKYVVGISQTKIVEQIQTKIVYLKIFLDKDNNNSLNQLILYSQEISEPVNEFYASLYSQSQGFISYSIQDNQFKTFHFSYFSQNNMILKELKSLKLKDHLSMLGSQDYIYIIQSEQTQYALIKINNENFNIIFTKTTPLKISLLFQMAIIDNAGYILNYSFTDSSLIYTSIDFSTETLIIKSLSLQTSNNYDGYNYQRIGNYLMISLISNTETRILKLVSFQNVQGGTFKLEQAMTFPYHLSKITFISSNMMISVYNESFLQIYDIKRLSQIQRDIDIDNLYFCRQQAVYQIEIQKNLIIQKIENIQNNLLLYLYSQDNDEILYANTISVQVNLPSLIINGINQDKIIISITSGILSNIYDIQLNISLLQQLNSVVFTTDQVSLSNLITNISKDPYFIPIENYVLGSDLDLQVTIGEEFQQTLQNMAIQKFIPSFEGIFQFSNLPNQSCNQYHTDNIFFALLECQVLGLSAKQVFLSVTQNIVNDGKQSIQIFNLKTIFNQSIDIIDNYGSFTLEQVKNDISKQVYLLFINGNDLNYNTITFDCQDNNYSFASDPTLGILFINCDDVLTFYKYKYTSQFKPAQIISQTIIPNNPKSLTQMICTKGYLIMSNESIIVTYDYINEGYIGTINIPTLQTGQNQNVILFKNSFFISVINPSITQITQYSYNNYSDETPVKLRNIQIDQNHVIGQSGNHICLRGEIEYLFFESTKSNSYILYRVDSQQSQNQLYATISFQNQLNIFNFNMICTFFNPDKDQTQFKYNCLQILESASILYNLNLEQDHFNQILSLNTSFSLSINDQTQNYNLAIKRNGKTSQGIVDQQSIQIQNIKTQLQDTNYSANQIFSFNDKSVFNACLTGWDVVDTNTIVINKITTSYPITTDQVYTILYNLNVTVKKNSIISRFFNITGSFQNCIPLDDQASLKITGDYTYQFTLYIFCFKQIYQYSIAYTSDANLKPVSSKVTLQKSAKLPYIPSPFPYKRIIEMQSNLYLFEMDGITSSILVFNEDNQTAQINNQLNNYYTKRSINVILTYDIQLIILNSGLISYQRTDLVNNSNVIFIQSLLSQFSFNIDQDDYINNIEQYTDTSFRIVFANSYIYDVEFSYNQDSNNLTLLSARKFYYKNAFPNYTIGFKGTKYTLLFGYYFIKSQIVVALYSNSNDIQNEYLIESTINQVFSALTYPTSIIELKNNIIQVSLSISQQYTINISDTVGLQIVRAKSSQPQKSITALYPLGQDNPKNTIYFPLNSSSSPDHSSAQNLRIHVISFLATIAVLIF